MGSYLESVRTGFAAFTGVGALALVPLVLLHYWRFGRVEPRRALVLYGLLAYGIVALALIFLPFPADRAAVCTGDEMLSLVPFQWVTDMRNHMAAYGQSGIVAMATSQAFLQQAFNVGLFVPLGAVLRKAYGWGPFSVVALGLGVSLVIEVVQYTGNLGFYPCPYRIADIDDLISNTTGTLLGWMIAPAAFVVPRVPSADESARVASAVTVPRRLAALVVDLLPALMITKLDARWAVAFVVTTRVLVPLAAGGRSPGAWLLRYRIRPAGVRLVLRELLGATGFVLYIALVSPTRLDLLVVAWVVAGSFVVPVCRRDQRGWPDLLARTSPERCDRLHVQPPLWRG